MSLFVTIVLDGVGIGAHLRREQAHDHVSLPRLEVRQVQRTDIASTAALRQRQESKKEESSANKKESQTGWSNHQTST